MQLIPPRLGPARRPAQPDPRPMPRRRSTPAALVKDLKAARPARRHAGRSGAANSAAPSTARARSPRTNYGRDHHGRCFTIWMAGGGIKPGITYGETDDFCYNIAKDPVHIHDLNATILALPGHRPQAADLPLPGPRFPPDRRARRSGQRIIRVAPSKHIALISMRALRRRRLSLHPIAHPRKEPRQPVFPPQSFIPSRVLESGNCACPSEGLAVAGTCAG